MKVWITKYALTAGIQEREAEIDESDGTAAVKQERYHADYYHGEGRDWHRTLEGAIARAEEMRATKIASLRKSIVKMEKLRFGPKAE